MTRRTTPSGSNRVHWALPAAVFWALLCAPPARAEVTDLSRGAPLQVEDTEVSKKGEFELQLPLAWEKGPKGEHDFEFLPQLQIGLTDQLQLEISEEVKTGSGEQAGTGDLDLRLLGKVWEERGWKPSVALATEVELPTGLLSHGVETTFWFITTKSISSGQLPQRVHVNAAWRHRFEGETDQRENRYEAVLGYDCGLGQRTLLMADLDVAQQEEPGTTYKFVEIGVREEITSKAVMGVGVGTGLDSHSPHLRLTASLEISF